jgi:TonB family protein
MTWSKLFSIALTLVFCCSGVAVPRAFAQAAVEKPQVVLVNLSPVVYPPLARQARIQGDVKVQLQVRADGSVASAEVISGHPMLKQAALESAQKSQFECHGCADETTSHVLTYTFGIRDDKNSQINACTIHRLRAAKCLYLWRCGRWVSGQAREPARSYWNDHVTIFVDGICWEAMDSRTQIGENQE